MLAEDLKTRIDDRKNALAQTFSRLHLPGGKLWEQLACEWVYNSDAIEGGTTSLEETRQILTAGRGALEILDHREAISCVEELVQTGLPIRPFHVRQIHALLMQHTEPLAAGQYRQTPVRINGAGMMPPEPWQIPHLMDQWNRWIEDQQPLLHPVELAALAHYHLAAVHPFVDGNGRTCRLVMNFLLLKAEYPISIIQVSDRDRYLHAMLQADAENFTPLVEMVALTVEQSLSRCLQAASFP